MRSFAFFSSAIAQGILAIGFGVALSAPTLAQMPRPATGDASIVAADAAVELIFSGGCVFTEGPTAAPDGRIFFTDVTFTDACRDEGGLLAGRIWVFDPASGETTLFREPSHMAIGMTFDANGDLIAAEGADYGGRRISRTNLQTGEYRIVAAQYHQRPLNSPNDVVTDAAGRIYFTDPRYVGHEPIDQPIMGVYRIDPDGSVTRIISELSKPNGIRISPDGQTLYVAMADTGSESLTNQPEGIVSRHGQGGILAYDLAADGTPSNPRVVVDFEHRAGVDGMTLDTNGNLYAAVPDPENPGIYVFTPTGAQLAYIPTPVPPTNVTFGRGEDASTLYITTVSPNVYRIQLESEGYHLGSGAN